MYILFREKNILPHEYYNAGDGEKKVIKAFLDVELEERRKEAEELRGQAGKGK